MHIKPFKEWTALTKATVIASACCIIFALICLFWHGLADFYTAHVYIWISAPLAFISSVLPFSLIGWLSVWRIPVLCLLAVLFGVALFVFKKNNALVLKIGVPVLFVSLMLFLLSLIGSAFYDHSTYTLPFFVACGTTVGFIVLVAILRSRFSSDIGIVWIRTAEITLICVVIIMTVLCLIPALTTTITDQNNKQDVSYSQSDMVEFGLSCLDDMEIAYKELVALSGSPDRVKFPVYDELKDDLIASMRKASAKYPSLRGYYPNVRFYQADNPIFQNNIVGLFVPGTAEILIKNNLRNSELPAVIAHEYAHLKGFLRESEADYIADYVCINSDNPWIRYSGYYNIFSRMLSVLRSLQNIRDYNVLVLRYNKMFNDAQNVIYLTPDNEFPDYETAFTLDVDETLSADLKVTLDCPFEDYAQVWSVLSSKTLSKVDWNVTVESSGSAAMDSTMLSLSIDASLGNLLTLDYGKSLWADTCEMLTSLRSQYAGHVDWSISIKKALGFSPDELIEYLKTDITETLKTRAGTQSLLIDLPFVHVFETVDSSLPFIEDLQKQANDLSSALLPLTDTVSFRYQWTGIQDLGKPITVSAHIMVSVPADQVPEDLVDEIRTAVPSVQSKDFSYATVSLENTKSAAKLAAEAEALEKRRTQAESVFEPVGYFTFTSAGSDYATSIRYLMEMYLSK